MNRTTIMARKKGMMCRITFVMVVFAMPQPRNKHDPTGGVQMPMHKLVIIMMPKWTGWTPSCLTIGKNIGVKMSTAGVISIKVPTNKSKRLMIKRITTGLFDKPSKALVIVCGIFSCAST